MKSEIKLKADVHHVSRKEPWNSPHHEPKPSTCAPVSWLACKNKQKHSLNDVKQVSYKRLIGKRLESIMPAGWGP